MPMTFGSFASRVVATAVVAVDGTGDFTDIQAAIDSLPAGGGVVYIKEGTYTITSAITITSNNVSLVGAGRSTKIQSTGNHEIIHVDTAEFATIQYIYFSGSGSGKPLNHGIVLDGSSFSNIRDCWIYICGGHSIVTTFPSEGHIIKNNFIFTSYKSGIYLNPGDNCMIINNFILGNDAGLTASYDGLTLISTSRCVIVNNRFKDNDRYEINISNAACNSNIVLGNHCYGGHEAAINDQGTGTEIAHNLT